MTETSQGLRKAAINPTLDAVAKRLNRVTSKREGFALAICGEPGIGKTFQADRLAQAAACRSVTLLTNSSPRLWARALPRAERLPVWAERSLERLEAGENLEVAPLSDALAARLLALAPFVLRLEDWHLANPGQLVIWSAVARSLKGAPGVAIIASGRGAAPADFESLLLEPLDAEAARSILQAQVGAALPQAALGWIHRRARGNPLFTLEYFRFLARSGFLWNDAQRWRWRDPGVELMPTSVEALLAQSLEPLRHGAPESLLRALAILPDGVETALLSELTALAPNDFEQALLELHNEGVLHDQRFAQPLLRNVVLGTLSALERRDLAHQALLVLQADHPVLAAALIEDAQLEPAQAIGLLERGAQGASGRQAAQFLLQLAERASPSERGWRCLQAAQALQRFDAVEALRLAALAAALQPSLEATLLEARLLASQGRFVEAERRTAHLDQAGRLVWLGLLLEAHYLLDDAESVLRVWRDHADLRVGASVALRVRVGYALVQLGELGAAHELHQTMLAEPLSPEDRAWVLGAAAIVDLEAGRLELAEQAFSTALLAFDGLDQLGQTPARRAATLANRSALRYRLGRLSEAVSDLETVLAWHGQVGDGRAFAEGQANLGTYLIALGEFERAEETLLESRAVLERIENPRALSLAEQGLVQLYLEWAAPHGAVLALRHAQAAERAARQAHHPPNLAQTLHFVAWAETLHGRSQRANALLEELEGLANQLGLAPLQITLGWLRGLLAERDGDTQKAESLFEVAEQQMLALGHGAYAQRLGLELDRLRNDLQSAQRRLAQLGAYPGWQAVANRHFPNLNPAPNPTLAPANATVRLGVLGPFRLEQGAQTLTNPATPGKLLLAMLLEARITARDGMAVLDLIDAIYPDQDEEKAVSALKQLVFRTRSSLGKNAILRTSNGYALGAITSDAEQFLTASSAHLWRGPALADLDETSCQTLRDVLHQALKVHVERLLEDDAESASHLASILRQVHPYEPAALALHLQALLASNDQQRLEHTYAAARAQFEEVGERLPSNAQAFLNATNPTGSRFN